MKTLAACLTLALLASTTTLRADDSDPESKNYRSQSSNHTGYGVPRHHYGFGAPVAGQIRHSSTAAEGAYRGMAAVIQAQGQYNLLTSLAMRNMVEVQKFQMAVHQVKVDRMTAMRNAAKERQARQLEARRSTIRNAAAARHSDLAQN